MIGQTPPPLKEVLKENEELRLRLEELEQTLNAIREGAVDALVVAGPQGENVFTLNGSEHNYRLLVESIDEGALTATRDGTILYCNAKFGQLVNQPVEVLIGRHVSDFIVEHERGSFESFLATVATEGKSREFLLASRNGASLSTKISIGPLDSDGISGISVIVTDLTDTKMAAALLSANAELSSSNAELEHFGFIASHDLKEPLRGVANYTQMLQLHLGSKFDEEAREFMKYILDSVTRVNGLIDDLLNYSRIGSGAPDFSEVDCTAVVSDVISNLETSIKECQCTISVSDLPVIRGNRTELTQLFQNLLSNSIKYRSAIAPEINVQALRDETSWIFSVRDNGIGIDPKYFAKVFVLFQRLHGKDAYSGTGVGLAICKKVVERAGGKIWVESKPGRGSTFYFSLPALPKKATRRYDA